MKDKGILIKSPDGDIHAPLTRFLRNMAKDTMTALAHEKAQEIGETLNNLSVRDTKTRWGSCSEDGSISLSWRLIFAPYEAMDYVIAHEVAHLRHLDHSRKFWTLCRELSDDYVEGKYWMDNHGHELMAYGAKTEAANT
jgi:predicted metal-dependent hydrolase